MSRTPTVLLLLAAWAPAAPARAGSDNPFDPAADPTLRRAVQVASRPAGDAARPGPADQAPPATQPSAETLRRIDVMAQHYVDLHAEHLQAKEWMGRAMAVIGLAVLDDDRATAKLLDAAAGDKALAVRVFAWACLSARQAALAEEQRRQWLTIGFQLDAQNALRGDLRALLLLSAAKYGPTPANRALFERMFFSTNTQCVADHASLRALRETLVAWRDPAAVKMLAVAMSNPDNAFRAEYVLAGLATDEPPMWDDVGKGTQAMIALAQARYARWLVKAKLAPAKAEPDRSWLWALAPRPEKIADPDDLWWRRKLELPQFQLEQVDVTFVVDSTGSMSGAIFWLRQEVKKMMRACGMVSRRPRVGVVFYRDYGDEYVVRPVWLTNDAQALFNAVCGTAAQGGGDVAEAVYDGLATALLKQQWSTGPRTHRAIVLIGDAPPHEAAMPKVRKLMEAAAEKDFRTHCVKAITPVGGDLSAFDEIARWGKGSSVWATFEQQPRPAPFADAAVNVAMQYLPEKRDIIGHTRSDKLSNRVVYEVVRTSTPREYQDRVEPFVDLLMEYVSESFAERQPRYIPAQPGAIYVPQPPRHPQAR